MVKKVSLYVRSNSLNTENITLFKLYNYFNETKTKNYIDIYIYQRAAIFIHIDTSYLHQLSTIIYIYNII